jgi:DNA-binding beta-propeller fold protein YncE
MAGSKDHAPSGGEKMRFVLFLMGASLFAQAPEIPFDSSTGFLKMPEHIHLGEVAGVATTSKGNILVYTRTGEGATAGASRVFTHGGSRLFEFSPAGVYLREIGVGIYGFMFAQSVSVDAQDNIWTVDRGSDMVIKFDPAGRVLFTLSRKPESVTIEPRAPAAEAGRGGGRGGGGRGPVAGDNFNRPTGVAWDAAGNIFVSDGYNNARIAKMDKTGKFVKSFGVKGTGDGQLDMPNSIAVDAKGNVYVADLGNKRIQVFDNDGNYKTQYTKAGAPWAVCISPGAHQFLYSSNSNAPDSMDNGEIYKMELDGTVIGKFGKAGKGPKEFGTVNQIDCRNPNTLYLGEVGNWRVQKVTLK